MYIRVEFAHFFSVLHISADSECLDQSITYQAQSYVFNVFVHMFLSMILWQPNDLISFTYKNR